ncbi:MAG: hypothetical protein WAS21_03140 [Geminicoccaceae bacterium]
MPAQAACPIDASTQTTDAAAASLLPGDEPAWPVPPGDGLDSLACVYISAGVVRDLAAGFGHTSRETCYCATMATGTGPAPCSER